jgi:hypothetical protein
MESAATDPVKYPTVRLDGKDYELKFRASDLVNLQKNHSIDLFVPVEVKGVAALEKLGIIIAAAIAHTGAALTPEQVMDSIELGEVPIYSLAVIEAQKKVSPEATRALKTIQAMLPSEAKNKVQ